ncbi:MAG: hypothetical protein U9P10_02800 [Thermodesulfobacteriota bacterium]|nr:hypothetical protein [Thermodesulfobacteriota bacterium]
MKLNPPYKFFLVLLIMAGLTGLFSGSGRCGQAGYEEIKMCFHNFIRCELTRTDAQDYFNGKSFEINMINLFDAVQEGDMLIATGAVKCAVDDQYVTLYTAVGVKPLLGSDKVFYFLVRKNDFSILATELARYPYKERCPWSRYWVDLD